MKKKIFNSDQMNEIRIGLEEGLDVSKYIQLSPHGHPIYAGYEMSEIREGLAQDLDISQYNQLDPQGHPIFVGSQMHEIRKGLEQGLDISQYTQLNHKGHPIYNAYQMHEIRIGLLFDFLGSWEEKSLINLDPNESSKSSLSDFDKTPTDLKDSKVINEYNKSSHTPSDTQSKSRKL